MVLEIGVLILVTKYALRKRYKTINNSKNTENDANMTCWRIIATV